MGSTDRTVGLGGARMATRGGGAEGEERIRVLHCPTLTGGNPQQLARAEREVGLESWAVAMFGNYLNYPADEVLLPARANPLQREWKRWQLFWRALRHFDVIHFNFGMSLMPEWFPTREGYQSRYPWALSQLYLTYAALLEQKDLPLLRRMGKGIVVTYQGDDARQGDFCRENFEITFAHDVEPEYYLAEEDEHKRRRIARFARYADRIYALNPDLLRVLPPQARFLPYGNVDPRDWRVVRAEPRDVPVVVHAPTHRAVKGTGYILDAVDRLQAEGIRFEFTLVEHLSNEEARRVYERADLVVDQLLAGWYGGLAVELMALGKPVLSYIRREDLEFIPPAMRDQLPIVSVTPDTVYAVLKEYLTRRRGDLREIGARGRSYVETWHDPRRIAAELKRDYESILRSKN
jgi:glycosyltransferase involved in cell wall biosynthesis